jgi:alanyl-tRNA synthetase
MKSSNEIRKEFIEFFISKKHKAVHSAPVIPIDDPTLLFTNAGMNQFKNIFLGKSKADYPRVADSQKCIRAGGKHNDLEEVGKDGYHHTFFEMLGNWSFGDYYKKEAISWAWELFTEVWKLPKDKLYATVYKTDTEAFELWKSETDIETSHIEYHDDKDNFWEMGATGPCGPCSEIHIDRGIEHCNLKNDSNHKCRVNGDCHRYIELWNLVFIQFFRDENGKLSTLTNKFVDTGAGFERVVQVLQDKDSNYHTDLFMPIIDKISEMSGVEYSPDDSGTSHRVIADHIRALSFAIADGGMPSNEGRGYVLRRILRRAARHGRSLNFKKPFLHLLVDSVVNLMGDHFPELKEKQAHVKLIVKAEEERFNQTLDIGLEKFNEITKKNLNVVSGKDAFMLYDTFGFPFDLTQILAEEQGLEVDEVGFKTEMDKQRKRARDAAKFEMDTEDDVWTEFLPATKTEFVGYDKNTAISKIQKYSIDDKNNVKVVMAQTPFYAESGGQAGDRGILENAQCKIEITDVKKQDDVFIHIGKLLSGEINSGEFTASLNSEKRKNTARNHTATHILHKALKEILGDHVQQKGSLVNDDHLRFDFTHFQQVSKIELDKAERLVNEKVRECLPVTTEIQTINEAKKSGATALFGEKYDDKVRVVSTGDFSKELCGGTHLNFTGEIGFFKITSESSIAAGIRRIEAITGLRAEKYVKILENEFDEIGELLNAKSASVSDKLQKLIAENKKLHIQFKSVKLKAAGNILDDIAAKAISVNGVKLAAAVMKVSDQGNLRQIGDRLREKLKSGIGVLAADVNGKAAILVIVTKDLTNKYHAGKIVGKMAEIVGGKGGGRPDMAMAGGKDVSKLKEAVQRVPEILKSFD